MHCLLIALNNGRTFANLSELLRVLLSARCKHRLHCRNSVVVMIADTNRLWQSSRLSQYISCLCSLAYPLTKRILKKALSFSTVMLSIFFPFQYFPRKIQITHTVIDFFQGQGLIRSMHSIVAVQNYQCVSNWLFYAF